jgi:hypothetical protein
MIRPVEQEELVAIAPEKTTDSFPLMIHRKFKHQIMLCHNASLRTYPALHVLKQSTGDDWVQI